jgi:hypothetical protein
MISHFTIYNPNTGKILRTGICDENCVSAQVQPGEDVLKVAANLQTHYVANGALVDIPPKPSENYIFDYEVKQWVWANSLALENIRTKRNELLTRSDWTQLPDVVLSTKQAWALYRQALRDITEQPDLDNIVWPTPPQ